MKTICFLSLMLISGIASAQSAPYDSTKFITLTEGSTITLDSTFDRSYISITNGIQNFTLNQIPYEVYIGDYKLIKALKDLEERNKQLEEKLNAILKLLTDKPKEQ